MRIINISKSSQFIARSLWLKAKLGFIIIIIFLLSGCFHFGSFEKARVNLQQSEIYYQCALGQLKDLIAQGKDLDRLYLTLGQVYYRRGDFKEAIGAFEKTADPRVGKFLAISYYRMGNFTDALEAFNKAGLSDDESLYYWGMTAEKLNLFDRALELYKKIKGREFKSCARERAGLIQKQVKACFIKDVDPRISAILEAAPSQESYPQAGALVLSCDEKVEVRGEGKKVFYLHYLIKILNERGKKDFSETQIDYDSTYDKVELEYARTIKPDGEVVEVGSRHIRDVSKYLNFPLYSNVRVYIISFPEVADGAVIEYKLKIHSSELVNKKDFVLNYPLQASEPVIEANFQASIPKENPLHIKTLNEKYNTFAASVTPQIKEEGGYLIYNWQFKNIPQIIPESNMPPSAQINPSILVSTFDSWQEIYDWWWQQARDKIKADRAIKVKLRELTARLDTAEAKIRAIYNFCAKDIRYVAVEYGQAGYEPHQAADIFKNKYGDCKDQAILLVAMLKEAGFSAWPVLIATSGSYNLNQDFPALPFDHCIAAVSLDNRVVFLDPTAETCSFGDLPAGDQGRRVLVFKEDGYEIKETPLYTADHNRIEQRVSIKMNADGSISAKRDIFAYGFYDQAQRYWLLYTPPQLIAEAIKEKIQDISIASVLDGYDLKNLDNLNEPVVFGYTFHGSEYATLAGNLRIMPQLSGLDTSLAAKDKRGYPIDFGILDSKETIFEIEIPNNFVVKYLPASVSEESPWLKFSAEYKTGENKIFFNQKLEVTKKEISENEYPDFKRFFEALAKRVKQRIVLEEVAK